MAPANFKDWDQVPDAAAFVPDGRYTFLIEAIEPETSSTGKFMYSLTARITAPRQYAGLMQYDRFVIGTDDDPEANDPNTWTSPRAIAVKRLKSVFAAANLNLSQPVSLLARAAHGKAIDATVVVRTEPELRRDGTPNAYAGRQRNEIGNYYRPAAAGAPATATSVPPPRPVAPTHSTSTNAEPVAAVRATATAVRKPKPISLQCGICDMMVPRAQYEAHEQAHIEAGELPSDAEPA